MGRLIDANDLLTVTDIRADGTEFTYVSYLNIEEAPTVLTIPNNPTNGDMIESLLSIKDKWEGLYIPTSKKQVYIKHEGSEDVISFDAEWWNAPFKSIDNNAYADKQGLEFADMPVLRSAT